MMAGAFVFGETFSGVSGSVRQWVETSVAEDGQQDDRKDGLGDAPEREGWAWDEGQGNLVENPEPAAILGPRGRETD